MVFREFEKKAVYRGRRIEIPYTIIFYNFGSQGPKTSAGVVVNWKRMKRKGEYCEGIKCLSDEQLNESNFQTRFSFNPTGKYGKNQKSSARQFVYKKLEKILDNPQVRGLIYD